MTELARKVFELFGAPELSIRAEEKSIQEHQQFLPSWPCPACGGVVCLDPPDVNIFPTRFWICSMCDAVGATREGARFPVVWVSKKTIQ
ncbi:MAG: hypothetical protein AB7G75_31690 [Candidatus Binatia bacterium]